MRGCLRDLLEDSYRVSDAVDAAGALKCMTVNGAPNVLVADMQLGSGMNGLELVAVARLRCPEMRALLITGTSTTDPLLDPGDRFLRKPFTIGALTYAVWELATRQDKLGTPCPEAPATRLGAESPLLG